MTDTSENTELKIQGVRGNMTLEVAIYNAMYMYVVTLKLDIEIEN